MLSFESICHKHFHSMKINSTIPMSHYKGSQKPANSPLLEQLSEPSDTHDEPRGSLEETGQLAVVLLRKLEGKRPKAPAQR